MRVCVWCEINGWELELKLNFQLNPISKLGELSKYCIDISYLTRRLVAPKLPTEITMLKRF